MILRVERPDGPRDRLSAFARPVLVIPQLMLVGGPALGLLGGGYRTGALGGLAVLIAIFDWFAILFTGRPVAGLQPLKSLYLTWRARVLAYAAFLRDEYPPFGEGAYPARLELAPPPAVRDRREVLLRPLFLLPHLVVLLVLLLIWVVAAFASWLSLSITGRLPPALWELGRDIMAYSLRVEAYALLLHDVFPPFALSEPGEEQAAVPPAPEPVR